MGLFQNTYKVGDKRVKIKHKGAPLLRVFFMGQVKFLAIDGSSFKYKSLNNVDGETVCKLTDGVVLR